MILITGATGFIGSKLVEELINADYEVGCLCRTKSNYERVKSFYNKCKWYNLDEIDIDELFRKNKIEAVIHCATAYGKGNTHFADIYYSNCNMPLELLKAASKHGTELFINTDSFFTKPLDFGWKIGQKTYMDNYTKSKYIFREIARENIESCTLAFINLRLEHVYGEGDNQSKFVGYLVNNLKKGTQMLELSDGLQKRDWVYVDDVVSAYRIIVDKRNQFQVGRFYTYEIGTGIETSLREFCEKAKVISGSETKLIFGAKEMQRDEIQNSVADNKSIKNLGWSPCVTIDEGIRRLFEG